MRPPVIAGLVVVVAVPIALTASLLAGDPGDPPPVLDGPVLIVEDVVYGGPSPSLNYGPHFFSIQEGNQFLDMGLATTGSIAGPQGISPPSESSTPPIYHSDATWIDEVSLVLRRNGTGGETPFTSGSMLIELIEGTDDALLLGSIQLEPLNDLPIDSQVRFTLDTGVRVPANASTWIRVRFSDDAAPANMGIILVSLTARTIRGALPGTSTPLLAGDIDGDGDVDSDDLGLLLGNFGDSQ